MALVPVRSHKGAAKVRPYWVATSTTIYEGQLLLWNSDGTVSGIADDADSAKIAGVAAHAIVSDSTKMKQVLVYDDPEQIFRGKKASGTFTQTDVGLGVITSGNASAFTGGTSKISACLLGASTATNPIVEVLKIVGLAFKADAQNDVEGIFGSSTTATEAYVIINPSLHLANNAIPAI